MVQKAVSFTISIEQNLLSDVQHFLPIYEIKFTLVKVTDFCNFLTYLCVPNLKCYRNFLIFVNFTEDFWRCGRLADFSI